MGGGKSVQTLTIKKKMAVIRRMELGFKRRSDAGMALSLATSSTIINKTD